MSFYSSLVFRKLSVEIRSFEDKERVWKKVLFFFMAVFGYIIYFFYSNFLNKKVSFVLPRTDI